VNIKSYRYQQIWFEQKLHSRKQRYWLNVTINKRRQQQKNIHRIASVLMSFFKFSFRRLVGRIHSQRNRAWDLGEEKDKEVQKFPLNRGDNKPRRCEQHF